MVERMEAVDDQTVKVITKEPTAPLLSYLTQFIITNKAIFDRYGAKVADEQHPIGAGQYKLERLVPGQMFALTKNPEFPGMQDRRDAPDQIVYQIVREAVCYAIDRDAIVKSILRGQAMRLDGVVGPGQYGFDPSAGDRYPFDPEKAKALLKEAGFPNGVDVDFYT